MNHAGHAPVLPDERRGRRIGFLLLAALSLLAAAATTALRDPASTTGAHHAHAADARIDLNAAPAAELELLPGIGPALAQRIVADREARGPFRSLSDLDRVPGIGPRTIERLAPFARAQP